MGKYRFRLSDMIPNAWFYKLRDMNRPRNHHRIIPNNKQSSTSSSLSSSVSLSSSLPQQNLSSDQKHATKPHMSEQRKSYYFTRDINLRQDLVPPEPPRNSSRRRRSTKKNRRPEIHTRPTLVSSSVSAGCSCKATMESVWAKPGLDCRPEDEPRGSSSEPDSILGEYGSDRSLTPDTFEGALSKSSSCKCRAENDIVIDMVDDDDNKPFNDLPRIITKKNGDDDERTKIQRTSAEFSYGSLSVKVVKEDILSAAAAKTAVSPAVRRIFAGNSSSSPGVKLRTNSPKIANVRRIQGGRKSTSSSGGGARRSVSDSFAVVKSSKDPRRDFRESMVEMILENNIRTSKDLEELLACYLSLNSDEYHDIIINVFKQIWFDFIHFRLK